MIEGFGVTYRLLMCAFKGWRLLSIILLCHYALTEGELFTQSYRRDVSSKTFERQALWDAYEAYGINHHDIQNEFELLSYSEMKSLSNLDELQRSLLNVDDNIWEITNVHPRNIWNDEMVTVSFTTSSPHHSDWIAAYSPADVDISTTVPVKYGFCDDFNPAYNITGKGTITFNMTNLRADVRFYYIIGGFNKNKTAVNNTNTHTDLKYFNVNEQLRPRVVPTGDYDVFNVMWSSSEATKEPTLIWSHEASDVPGFVSEPQSTADGKHTSTSNIEVLRVSANAVTVKATTDRIDKSEFCGWPANDRGWRDMGLIHSAQLVGMKKYAGSKIYYTFGDKSTNTWSSWGGNATQRVWELFIPPLPGTQPKARPTTLVWYDDLGRGSNDQAWTWNHYGAASIFTAESVGHLSALGKIDGIYHGGDLSYAVGYEAVWDFYMDMMSPMAAHTLYMTTVGNHETDSPTDKSTSFYRGSDSGGECTVSAIKMLPQPKPATKDKPWWSYKIGLFHVIGLSSEHNFTHGSEQWKWLEADLQSINRTESPWVLFGAYRSMYISSDYGPYNKNGEWVPSSDNANMDLMVRNLEPLLWKYRVNLGIYGHMHCVQRQSAILEFKVVQAATIKIDENGNEVAMHANPQATVHYMLGTGGADLMTGVNKEQPAWNEKNWFKWGYSIIEAVNATQMNFRFIDATNDEVLDRMIITQPDPALITTSTMWECPGTQFKVCAGANSPTPAPSPSPAPISSLAKIENWMKTHQVALFCSLGALFAALAIWWYFIYKAKRADIEKTRNERANSATVILPSSQHSLLPTEDDMENNIENPLVKRVHGDM